MSCAGAGERIGSDVGAERQVLKRRERAFPLPDLISSAGNTWPLKYFCWFHFVFLLYIFFLYAAVSLWMLCLIFCLAPALSACARTHAVPSVSPHVCVHVRQTF